MSMSPQCSAVQREPFNKMGFWALLVTQFQGAFSDNVYKLIIILYLPALVASAEFPATALSTAVFNLPWLMFPAIAGALADRYSKKWVTVATKIWEIGVMMMGVMAVLLRSPYLLLFTLFLMAMQSTFFSPAKYGILPEILPESRLSWGNGLLNMWTFLAIILGNAAAGFLLAAFREQVYFAMLVMVGLSGVGVAASLFVTPARPAEPTRRIPINPYAGIWRYVRVFWGDARLFQTLVGIAFFWAAGALVIQNVVELGKVMVLDERLQGVLLAVMALGIGMGSLAAGYLSRGKIEMGLAPIGFLGMAFFCVLMAIPGWGYAATVVLLFGLGACAGVYDVPLAAMMQQRSPDKIKGGMIATLNLATFGGMMVAAALFWLLFNKLGIGPSKIFLTIALVTLGVGAYLIWLGPVVLLRSILWLADGTLYSLHVKGRGSVPEKGGALLVANHVSIIEAMLLLYSTDREVHFVMGADILRTPRWRHMAHVMNVILVDPNAGPEALEGAVSRIREVIARGHVVCVNCEARLHPEGTELPWHQHYSRIVEGLDAPVIPVHVSRLWETLYTFKNRRIQWRRPTPLRYPVAVYYGAPQPASVDGPGVRAAVQQLGVQWCLERPYACKNLHAGFIWYARRNLRKMAAADALSGELSYFRALVGSIIFARKLKVILDKQPMTGVLVPPTVGGLLTNIALQMLGRVPVNLNYTASPEILAACARRCNITQVLTSRRFLERLPLTVPGETVLLEDIRESVTKKDQITGMALALFAPVWLIERLLGTPKRGENDLATIIFSSGSEGDPKGVMLTLRSIISQTTAMGEVFPHDEKTCLLGFLPFFHSFGFTGTVWMPFLNKVRAVYHPSPLEHKNIGELAMKYRATVLIATSTFLQGFIRRCPPEHLRSLEFVVCGAEKLTPRVRTAFREKFGVEPVEGYGATECAPIVSINFPDNESPGFYARNLKHGTIGRPLPGVGVRVVHPETGELLPTGEAGLLQACGPNIMQGYLEMPEKTASVLQDGWYSTGDIAAIDDDGFIAITDRLARFSKIGGEMVPHTKVEETLHTLLDLTEQAMAVSSVPDTVKGERLVVLHTLSDAQAEELFIKMGGSDLPNLWRPRPNNFYRIDAIPVLGTGKMDIKAIKKMAANLDLGE